MGPKPNGAQGELGRRVQEARNGMGLTQRELAAQLNRPYASISRLEAGLYVRPNQSLVTDVARFLGLNPGDLIGLVDYETPDLPVYLRARYGLSSAAAGEVEEYVRALQKKYQNKEGGEDGSKHSRTT